MTLILQIENHQLLDEGTRAQITVPETGLAAGRAASMGWVLADPSRHVSGHHFDITHDAQGWWLRDVSTNGTFLQGSRYRLDAPHRLNHGDRFQVGQYIIVALVDAPATGETGSLGPVPRPAEAANWSAGPVRPAALDPLPPRAGRALEDFAQEVGDRAGAAPHFGQAAPAPFAAPGDQPARADPRHEITGIRAPISGRPNPDVVIAFCQGAGLPPELYAEVDAAALAQALGQAMRAVSQQAILALQDRAAAKQFARTGEATMRHLEDNNPLKFLPDPAEAIEAMFLRPRPGFRSGAAALDEAMSDLRRHQSALFAALQPALGRLLADLEPEAIEAEAEAGRMGGNRHAKAWEIFVSRWNAKAGRHENGMLDAFLDLFATSYRDLVDPATGKTEPRRG